MQILERLFKDKSYSAKRKLPICIFCYHKVGTVLLSKVFREICQEKGWKFQTLHGKQTRLPRDANVVLFSHSLFDPTVIEKPFFGLHIIRDPRDIIVSGYQYHRRTSEKWCTNSDLTLKPPILFPRVPYSQQHRAEAWKIDYLQSLNGISYQDNLLAMSQRDGLLFEMNHYGAWTIESMRHWDYTNDDVMEIKYEDLMDDYENIFNIVFKHFNFSPSELDIGMEVASRHNLKLKPAEEVERMNHVSSTKTSRWEDYFEDVHKHHFKETFGNVLVELGYESNNNW